MGVHGASETKRSRIIALSTEPSREYNSSASASSATAPTRTASA
ncbi:hypothetical protein BQ8420_12145 [Nocardiopsis sp. JB363]|nr:hypothetical protein BQ8420_12145 [Nocardiopsis sp. JB363]